MLPDPSIAAPTLRNTAAAAQHRRRPQLAVELVVPPSPRPKQPRERLHLAPTELPSPATSIHGRRNAAAAVQFRYCPPAHVEPPPRTSSPRTKDTQRCGS